MKKNKDIKVARFGVMKTMWDHMVRMAAQPGIYYTSTTPVL